MQPSLFAQAAAGRETAASRRRMEVTRVRDRPCGTWSSTRDTPASLELKIHEQGKHTHRVDVDVRTPFVVLFHGHAVLRHARVDLEAGLGLGGAHGGLGHQAGGHGGAEGNGEHFCVRCVWL